MKGSWQMLTGMGDPCHVHSRRVNASPQQIINGASRLYHIDEQHCRDALRDLEFFQKVMIVTFHTSREKYSNLTVEAPLRLTHANLTAASTITAMIAPANAYAWTAPEWL